MPGESETTQTGKIHEFGWCSPRPVTLQLSLGPWWGFGDPDGVAECESGRALGST